MARAEVRDLRPHRDSHRVNEHPVTAKITHRDFDALTALALIDDTNSAQQIRDALDYYFTLRMKDRSSLADAIAAARARHEATLAVISGNPAPPIPAPAASSNRNKTDEPPLDKPVTLRISNRAMDLITAFSLVDDATAADVLRSAVGEYIEHRRHDRGLARKLDAAKREYERTLASLAAAK